LDVGKCADGSGMYVAVWALLAGYTQTLNDFYDRDIDAINEPTAPFLRTISIPK